MNIFDWLAIGGGGAILLASVIELLLELFAG